MKILYTKITYAFLATFLFLLTPAPVSAVTAPTTLKRFAELVVTALQNIAALLFMSLAFGLVLGVILYFANSDNEQRRASIKGYLLWGVIGIIVVTGIWGIITLLRLSFGASGVGIPQIRPPQ
mgnify:CR=1 FL=1